MAPNRALPRLDACNHDFWTGGASGELRLMRCAECQSFTHPPRPVCRHCRSERVAAEPVNGTGTVVTYTVNHQPWRPDMEVPFVIARVAIDDAPGVILTANIVGCPIEDVDIGDRVRVVFEQQDDVYLPLFERVAG